MKTKLSYILAFTSCVFMVSCSEHDVLNSYDEIKEIKENVEELVPLSFIPYVATDVGENATTRADLNYLSNVNNTDENYGLSTFNAFPWYNIESHTGSRTGEITYKNIYKTNFRFGTYENNSYIVGMYGYYDHNWNSDTAISWSTLKDNTNLTSNFMTNQPLLHTSSGNNWNYTPIRYWPNSRMSGESTDATPVKVTFVSYYPFQDFADQGIGIDNEGNFDGTGYYRDGRDLNGDDVPDLADLRCIEPPAKDAKGKDAYLFTFKQNSEPGDQVDFLLGIDTDKTKQAVGSSGIDLHLKHTLCAVAFDLRVTSTDAFAGLGGASITYEINSISLEGLYGQGKVYPTNSGPVWDAEYLTDETTYTLTFEDYHEYLNGVDKPVFDGTARRYKRQFFYFNTDKNSINLPSGNTYVANSRGMKLLMLVIPQKVEWANDGTTPKNAYVVVNYDITYTYNPGTPNEINNVFRNNEEKIKLKDGEKDIGDKTQLFLPGKFITFNISFKGPKTIIMEDVTVSDWDDTVEYDLPTEEYTP